MNSSYGKINRPTMIKNDESRLGVSVARTNLFSCAERDFTTEGTKGRRGLHGKNICFVFSTMKDMKSMKACCEIFMSFMLFMVKKI